MIEQRLRFKVADVMTKQVITVGSNDPLCKPAGLIRQHGLRHLPVLGDDGQLCGVITGRDLFRSALSSSLGFGSWAQETLLETLVVKDAMTNMLRTTTPETPLADAAKTLCQQRIGCLPVLCDGRLVGILTEGDLVRLVANGDLIAA